MEKPTVNENTESEENKPACKPRSEMGHPGIMRNGVLLGLSGYEYTFCKEKIAIIESEFGNSGVPSSLTDIDTDENRKL
jgi:hypothetical protein